MLELGLASPSFDQMNAELDDRKNIAGIILSDPYAEQYQVFNTMGRSVDDNSLPDGQVEGYLQQVIQSRQDLVVPDPEHSRTTHYLFIDLENAKYGSDPSRMMMGKGVDGALFYDRPFASCFASRIAASMLEGFALPWPAMS